MPGSTDNTNNDNNANNNTRENSQANSENENEEPDNADVLGNILIRGLSSSIRPRVKVDTFDLDNGNILSFINDFSNLAEGQNWDDRTTVSQFRSYLKGEPGDWHTNNVKGKNLSWGEVKRMFLETYCPDGIKPYLRRQLTERKQTHKESIKKYLGDIKVLCGFVYVLSIDGVSTV